MYSDIIPCSVDPRASQHFDNPPQTDSDWDLFYHSCCVWDGTGAPWDVCAHCHACRELRLNVLTATWELITNARIGADVCHAPDSAAVFVTAFIFCSSVKDWRDLWDLTLSDTITSNNLLQSLARAPAVALCYYSPHWNISVWDSPAMLSYRQKQFHGYYNKCICSCKKRDLYEA